MCVRLRFGDKLVSTSLKVDTKPGVWLRNVVMISLCIMLTSRNQRIFKLISSAEFLEVHQNIQNWFRFLFFFLFLWISIPIWERSLHLLRANYVGDLICI